ncbi:iron-sulfur cluster assembly scaffold protein [Sphingorhabdus arenilitoris]|uniref:Iron-sulfur cluster assembly scaffold protein n=1 Tax=Sphingorhabdus arenilitoris TaxID=1490041 RepID=A0ABV8RET9_9SPHN
MLRLDDRITAPNGSAERRSATCGSKIEADVTIDSAGKIIAIAFRAKACALGQASAAIVQQEAPGQSRDNIAAVRSALAAYLKDGADAPDAWPGLEEFGVARDFPARHAAILLPYDAVLAAIDAASTAEKQAAI